MMYKSRAVAIDAGKACYPELSGKRVLVTGAERSIGFSIAKAFARQQARLVLQAARLSAAHRISGNALRVFECRPRNAGEIERLTDAAVTAHAGLDISVSVTALPADWRETAAIDPERAATEALTIPFLTGQRVAERMRLKNIRGTLITVAILPPETRAGAVGRTLLRTALATLVRRQAEDQADYGIRAYGIAVDPLVGPANPWADDDDAPAVARTGRGRAVAEAALLLARPQAAFLSGQTLTA